MRIKWFMLVTCLTLMVFFIGPGCSQEDDEEQAKKDDSVVIRLQVENDDLFGFEINRQVGTAWLSDSRGPVGSPVRCVVEIEDIDRFDEMDIDVKLELQNPDSIKLGEFVEEHQFDDERTEFKFIVPQILTVPTVLNFRVYLNVYDDDSNDYFEARGFYQFFVNQGTPAT